LDPEGSPKEETRIKSGSAALFFGGGDGFKRYFSVTSSVSFSCESAVCSRVKSWRQNWNRSCPPKLPKDSSFEDLKCVTELQQDKAIPGRNSRTTTYDASRPKFGRTFFPARGGGRLSRGLAGMAESSSSPEEGERAPSSSNSSTLSASPTFARFAEARDVVGTADADSDGASTNSRLGYSPSSGWGG
jgi:hypothetical protein